MFRRKDTKPTSAAPPAPAERVTSVLGSGTIWKGSLSGSGGVRIEGAFEGEISLRGMLVIGATGRVTCPHLRANTVIIAGAVQGDITAEKVEIRASGRVWGDVVTVAFSTEEGAFLRGQIRMEDKVDIAAAGPGKPEPIVVAETETGKPVEAAAVEETLPSVVDLVPDFQKGEATVQTLPTPEEPADQPETIKTPIEGEDEGGSSTQESIVQLSSGSAAEPVVEQPPEDQPSAGEEPPEIQQ
jgi:cytoskeletal protein CcmA (bactofilin family)